MTDKERPYQLIKRIHRARNNPIYYLFNMGFDIAGACVSSVFYISAALNDERFNSYLGIGGFVLMTALFHCDNIKCRKLQELKMNKNLENKLQE